jgi:hypothetical protein
MVPVYRLLGKGGRDYAPQNVSAIIERLFVVVL